MLLASIERALGNVGVTRRGDDVVVVACSGGVDSTVLAHAAVTLLGGRRVVLGHVDHGVRPRSADDAVRVEGLARMLGASFAERRVAPSSDAEAELRALRYAALEAMRAEVGARFVLTAHTQDDQAETVLLNLVRTAHPDGLAGIPRRRGTIFRPMLDVPKLVVLQHAQRHDLSWCEDETNGEPRYLRNRVRKELLPLLERRYRPGIRRRLARLASRVSGRSRSADERSDVVVQKSSVERPFGFDRRPWSGGPIPDGRARAIFDAAQLGPISARPIRDGDRIRPFGQSFHRKVRDLLREGGVPVAERPRIWVVQAEDEVIWIPGLLRANGALVRETTKDVWVFWTSGPSE